jgi:DNA adenine methylase
MSEGRPAGSSSSTAASAGPFLKWAGGKGQLQDLILRRLPLRIACYFEPFVGGGAIFFALAAQKRFRRAVLADRNAPLIDCYRAVRDEVESVIRELRKHRYEKEYFYEVRAIDPETLDLAARAARIIFLNRTCFNGLYRVNRSGRFNVPFGRYVNPTLCNAEGLRAASAALQGVELVTADFEEVLASARPGDAVYFDPPYFPLSATSSFTAYDPYPFRAEDHRRLARVHRSLGERGVFALLSNSDCPFTRALFEGLPVETVRASRAINSVATRRKKISELLVGNLVAVSPGS